MPILIEIENLKKQLDSKTVQNIDLNACLVKQTTFCENLSELLRKSEQKNVDLKETEETNLSKIKSLENNLGKFWISKQFMLFIWKNKNPAPLLL